MGPGGGQGRRRGLRRIPGQDLSGASLRTGQPDDRKRGRKRPTDDPSLPRSCSASPARACHRRAQRCHRDIIQASRPQATRPVRTRRKSSTPRRSLSPRRPSSASSMTSAASMPSTSVSCSTSSASAYPSPKCPSVCSSASDERKKNKSK